MTRTPGLLKPTGDETAMRWTGRVLSALGLVEFLLLFAGVINLDGVPLAFVGWVALMQADQWQSQRLLEHAVPAAYLVGYEDAHSDARRAT